MNIYKALSILLKDSADYNFEDKVAKAAVKIAQNQIGDVRIDPQIMETINALRQENVLLKQQYTKLFTENQQLKGNLLNAEGNQVPSGVEIFDSSITPGGQVVQVDNATQPVTVRNQNYTPSPSMLINENGTQINSPKN